jgi:hypothetical protein
MIRASLVLVVTLLAGATTEDKKPKDLRTGSGHGRVVRVRSATASLPLRCS